MSNIYADRLAALRGLMRSKGWDALVLTGSDPHGSEYPAPRWKQVLWLTGFAGEAGDVLVTQDHAGLWTDSRYFIEAGRILPRAGFELHKTRVPEAVPIPQWLAEYADERPLVVAVDGLSQSVAFVEEIKAAGGEDLRVVDAPDVLDALWTDRPSVPATPVLTLGEEMTGESRADKILWLRGRIVEKGCDAILLSALDDIAWLLNVRGSDIPYNPLVVSYLLVSLDEVVWYVRKGIPDAETADSFAELEADGITVLPYDEAELDLAAHQGEGLTGRLWADPAHLNYHLSRILSGSLVPGPSPVPLRRACKNETELACLREAHVEDGLAMEQFLYWLERRLEYGEPVSERDAADRLGMFRARIPAYRGDSFETISAYGEGAALPHYVTPEEDAPVLEQRGLYLCDSGGQYLFGTTDITRTVPLGECTPLEKEDYTLVLKGHIALARAVFPKGTAGCHLDVLAREPLWRAKRNFGHGTGHGVGTFLCVHEGPQDIRQNTNAQPLLPGMVTSDEPGIYREGLHGVRHESLLLCKELGRNDFGTWLGFEVLTLCHIDTSIVLRELLSEGEVEWLNAYNRRVFEVLAPRLDAPAAAWLREKCRPI